MTDDIVERLRLAHDAVKLWPENDPAGFIKLLELRNLVPEGVTALEAAEARVRELEAKLAEAYERAAKVADDSASANLGPYAARGDMARFVASQIRKLAQEAS